MSNLTRRHFLRALTAAPVLSLVPVGRGGAQSPAPLPPPLRMLLNSGYSSVNAWFCLAEDRGYLKEAGLRLTFTDGVGAYTAAGRTAEEGFDIGYGDVNALIEQAAASNPRAPLAVYMMFNRSPSVVAVPAGSPIRMPKDFAGKHVRGHATDVALQTFPALAAKAGLDATTVRISSSEEGMGAVVQGMLKGEADGTFGYETTITAALITAKIPADRVRFFFYRDLVPELYGSALMVSKRLIAEQPALVAGLVRAVNRGVRDTIAEPAAALAALRRRVPAMVEPAERARLDLTLAGEMGHAEGARLGIGAIDPQRFAAGMHLLCETKRLAKVPAVTAVFNSDFPIPPTERITRLAAGLR